MLGVTALANAHRDDAGRALQSAVLTIVLAREMTSDSSMVARMAMAALLADVGRVRLVGSAGRDRFVRLGDAVETVVPPMTSAVSLGLGGINAQIALHTVIVFETTWLEREAKLGPLPSTLLQSRVVQLARAVLDLLAPRDNSRSLSLLDAIEALTKDPKMDRTLLKLLVKAVGLNPVGTVVELENGEWAVVAGPSKNPRAIDRPIVRVVIGDDGLSVDPPEEWDLGNPPPGYAYPQIVRSLPREEARFNVVRALR